MNFRPALMAVVVSSAFAALQAQAGGFQLTEQSALGLGRSYAGVGVDGADVSGAYYNPATMTLHSGTTVQAGVIGVDLNLEYEGENGHTENGREKASPVPHLFVVHQFNDQIYAGLSITTPFGMQTSYGSNWDLNHRGYYSKIMTVDINPSVAWKINEKFSIGAGISYQYVDATLKTRKNGGQTLGPLDAEFNADSGEWGWNIGAMWTPAENVRVGLSYRSEIEHTAKGDLELSSAASNAALAAQVNQGLAMMGMDSMAGEAVVSAPAWAMLNVAWDVNPQWSVYGTLRWTDWSSFSELSIKTASGTGTSIDNRWKDTYFGSVGFDYRFNPTWTFRAGIGLGTSPIKYADTRTGVIPDAKRLWLSLGGTYHATERFTIDFGAAHLHGIGERDMYDEVGGEKVGKFKRLDAFLLGAQMQYRF